MPDQSRGQKCDLCSCLNMCQHAKSASDFYMLRAKWNKLTGDPNRKLCERHRTPLYLNVDLQSVAGFLAQVTETVNRMGGRVANA